MMHPAFSVYFDANVYDQIDKRRISLGELDVLQRALKDHRLVVYLGIPVIEELLGQWETDRPAVIRKLGAARDFVGFDKILKPANVLLEEAVRAYAASLPPPSPFLPQRQYARVLNMLRGVSNGDQTQDKIVSKIVTDSRSLKKIALDQWETSQAQVHSVLSPYTVEAGQPQRKDLRWWLKSEELAYAEGLAKALGLDDVCRSRVWTGS